jgi:hypothetical protein
MIRVFISLNNDLQSTSDWPTDFKFTITIGGNTGVIRRSSQSIQRFFPYQGSSAIQFFPEDNGGAIFMPCPFETTNCAPIFNDGFYDYGTPLLGSYPSPIIEVVYDPRPSFTITRGFSVEFSVWGFLA